MGIPRQASQELDADTLRALLLLDWLVQQHICEWCNGTIDDFDCELNAPCVPKRKWRNRQVKKGGYTSNHWKFWLICRKCAALHDFSTWIFPVIRTMPVGSILETLISVQPMSQPVGEIFYADYVPLVQTEWVVEPPVGAREHGIVLDDATFRDADPPRHLAERTVAVDVYVQVPQPLKYIQVDCKITEAGVEPTVE